MPRRLGLGLVALAALAAPAAAAEPAPVRASAVAVPPIPLRERTLANGLRVYSALDRSTPNVTIQVWYGVGGKDDPEHRSGFAHLFEHMMFKATRDMPAEDMDRLTEDVGGFNNASTADDYTEYHEVVPAGHLERLLWAEAERMSALAVDQPNFVSERAVVEEELRQRVLANPYGRLQMLLTPEASFQVHPYKRPVIGDIADLEAAGLADVRAFHATYYRPDNASLIVIGNYDPARLDAWVDRYFAPIRRPDAPIPRVTAAEPPRDGPRTVEGFGPDVPLPAVELTFPAPPAASPDGAALQVLDALLTTGRSARLYADLVYQRQIAQDVFSNPDLRQQPGLFVLGAYMASGHGLDEGEAALRAELARLRDALVGAEELARAKNQLLAQALRGRETVDGRAAVVGQAIVLEGDARRADSDLAAVQAVSAADVQRVARLYLRDEARVVIRYRQAPPGAAADAAAAPSPPVAAAPLDAAASPPAPASLPATPPPAGPIVAPVPPRPASMTLANGLKVIVARTSALPLVTAELVVRRGASSDPEGLEGLQSLTAGLLTTGAGGRSAQAVAAQVEALGGSLDSAAGTDGTQVVLTVLSDQLGAGLPILADAVRRPALAADELERLRRQRLDALAVQLGDPGAVAALAARAVALGGSPYGHSPTGDPASLKRIGRADVLAQYARTVRPDAAVLVLTGDVTPEAGFALAERDFGDWHRPAAPPDPTPASLPPPAPRVVVVDMPGAGQAAVVAAAPSIARGDPDYYAAEVASALLGGGYSARLNEELRVRRGLTYGAGADIAEFRQVGLFTASAQTKPQSAAEVAGLMADAIAGLTEAPAPAAELEAREAALVGEFGRSAATSAGLAGQIASNYALYGIDADEIARFTPRIDAVSAPAAQAAAARAIDRRRVSLVVAGDARLFLPALKARFAGVQVVAASRLAGGTAALSAP